MSIHVTETTFRIAGASTKAPPLFVVGVTIVLMMLMVLMVVAGNGIYNV